MGVNALRCPLSFYLGVVHKCWWKKLAGITEWNIVVSDIPYQVPKSKLIENLAKIVQNKKLQLLSDIRDESTEQIRIVLEPKSYRINPETLMEGLFKLTELETRFSMNLNVLIDGLKPKVCAPWEILRAFLDHQKEILERCSKFRLKKIDHRLLILEGVIVGFINLDRVIEIIRYDDHPKSKLIEEFELVEKQAEAILNMRLRSLRKLEELELKKEQSNLTKERSKLDDLLHSDDLQWKEITAQLKKTREIFKKIPGSTRRTQLLEEFDVDDFELDEVLESEPLTIVFSQLGWIRKLKGTLPLDQNFKFRDGDDFKFALHVKSTEKLILFASDGRFYTLTAEAAPGGRSQGEPINQIINLTNDAEILAMFVHDPERQLLVASQSGLGFIVKEKDAVASTKSGKQVLILRDKDLALGCWAIAGDQLGLVSSNRKMLIFPISEVPPRQKGNGVILMKLKNAKLSDAIVFNLEDGLPWKTSTGKDRVTRELEAFTGKRAGIGYIPPRGFPKNNKFG